jgi:putative transposase
VVLYQNKYRIDSLRLARFDYSSSGEYFVTICTKHRICHFGDAGSGEIHLSRIGLIVQEEWQNTALIRTNVKLDAFVVMPNHVHGIIVICNSLVETTRRVVSTTKTTLQRNSLGSIVGQFKSVCTKRIHASGFHDFGWQRGYYDHIIRDETDLERIREYITLNPSRWKADDEFAVNVKMDPIYKGE